MRFVRELIVMLLLFSGLANTSAQRPIESWRDHLPYGRCIDVVMVGNLVYTATPYGIFVYNPFEQTTERINKTNRLSDSGISCIDYDPSLDVVFVGYANGNIDLLYTNHQVNVPDIKITNLIGDKTIYSAEMHNQLAYLSTGFGVVVLDLVKQEIKGTYLIGDNGSQIGVFDIEIHNDSIYAATSLGIRAADVQNPFLANFQNWSLLGGQPAPTGIHTEIEFFNGMRFANVRGENEDAIWKWDGTTGWTVFQTDNQLRFNDLWSGNNYLTIAASWRYQVLTPELYNSFTVYGQNGYNIQANAVIVSPGGKVYTANSFGGLLIADKYGLRDHAMPQGPSSGSVRRLDAYNDNIWVAHGGVNEGFSNLWLKADVSGLVNENWNLVEPTEGNNVASGVLDLMDVSIDPLNPNHLYLGSWEDGLIEILDGNIINEFNEENSTLELGFNMNWLEGGWIGVAGVDFSSDGILWCTNAFTSEALHARDLNGEFHSFDFSPQVVNTDKADGVVVTSNGWVWAIIRGKGLVVLNTNGTLATKSDDLYKFLNDEENSGGLPNNEIFCLAEDLDGEVWVGTLQGIAVFYSMDDVFSEDGVNAEQILIEQDGNIQILLETETVTAIEVDGGNRKWVGTANSGAFLFSADGQETIYHFTESNSPLLSNNILDIDINHGTGEVYFATDAGIVSFQSTGTNFVLDIEEVKVYPNPVRPDYEGLITIDGLAYQTDVRITDAAGNLVHNTTSEGGRATWNGLSLNGERVTPGVYLIFCSNPDGSTTQVAKVAVVR